MAAYEAYDWRFEGCNNKQQQSGRCYHGASFGFTSLTVAFGGPIKRERSPPKLAPPSHLDGLLPLAFRAARKASGRSASGGRPDVLWKQLLRKRANSEPLVRPLLCRFCGQRMLILRARFLENCHHWSPRDLCQHENYHFYLQTLVLEKYSLSGLKLFRTLAR